MLTHKLSSAFTVFAGVLLPEFESSPYDKENIISEEVLFQSSPKNWRINNEVRQLATPLHLLALAVLQPAHRIAFLNKKVHALSIASYLDANGSHIITAPDSLRSNIKAASGLILDDCIRNGSINEDWLKAHPNFVIASNEDFIFGSVHSRHGCHVGCGLIAKAWRAKLEQARRIELLVREETI